MAQFETYCTLWGVWSPEQGVDKFVEALERAKHAGMFLFLKHDVNCALSA